MEYIDYYQLLDIETVATSDEIEQGYRKLARKYHPDVNTDNPDVQQRFAEISEAHQVLSSVQTRSKYDELRQHWLTHLEQDDSAEFDWNEWAVQKPTTTEASENGNGSSADETYSEFFITIFGLPSSEPLILEEDNSNVEADETETREENSDDESVDPSSNVADVTTASDKTESSSSSTSSIDQETETSSVQPKKREYVQHIDITVEESYKGTRRVLHLNNQQMKINIPKGAKTGTRIRIPGKKLQLHKTDTKSGTAMDGDLYLEINVQPHPVFEVLGEDLQAELVLDLYTAMLGGEAIVPSLGRGKIKLKIPRETQPGKQFRLKNLGMPRLKNSEEFGDLLIKVVVNLPQNLTVEEIALFEELADLRGL
ncbi:DnaJ C-terminal domain-containing protein [Anaerolineales bacterium HSG25]|nr:DnaJ C-terminal domain-containing protein [Anaerolineales bacterium HSG25]